MSFGNIGLTGIIMILVVLLLFWGPSKLPEIGKALGRTLKEFRQATSGTQDESIRNESESNRSVEKSEAKQHLQPPES